MRSRIAYKLAAIWLAVAVPLVVILSFSYWQRYETRIALVQRERIGYAQLSALAFRGLIEDAGRTMTGLGSHFVDDAAAGRDSTTLFADLVKLYPAAYIVLADPDGTVIGASDRALLGEDFSRFEAFKAAGTNASGKAIEPSNRIGNGTPGFHVAQRVYSRDKRIIGVMLMRFEVRRIHDEYPMDVASGGVSIVDSEGTVVYQNEDPDFALEQAAWGSRYAFVRGALDGRISPTDDFPFPDGSKRIGAFVPVSEYGWAAGSSVAESEVLAVFWRSLLVNLPLAVGFSAAGLAVGAVISLRLRRALVRLAGDAEAIGDGDFERPVQVDRTDEIGDVAESLERARLKLQRYSVENERLLAAEHEVAEKLQSALLAVPGQVDGVEFAVHYRAASDVARVGGDFYDLFSIGASRVGMTIGDIAGHGVDAAVLTSLAKTSVRVGALDPAMSPSRVVETVNQVLYGGSTPEAFATLFYGVLDTLSGRFQYTSAGHTHGAVLSASGVSVLESTGPIVGAFSDVVFDEAERRLEPGDTLFLYTDGLIEARVDGELFGEQRLFDLLATLEGLEPESLAEKVFEEVSSAAGGQLRDDVAILVVRRRGATG